MIRASLIYFLGGVLLGAAMLAEKAHSFYPEIWNLLPIHIEVLIIGWIIQFTLGTAYWILPRHVEGPPRGNDRLAFGIPIFLNLGILSILSAYLCSAPIFLFLIGRGFELMAVLIFARLHWRRVSKILHVH